jgi:hypothetical protein
MRRDAASAQRRRCARDRAGASAPAPRRRGREGPGRAGGPGPCPPAHRSRLADSCRRPRRRRQTRRQEAAPRPRGGGLQRRRPAAEKGLAGSSDERSCVWRCNSCYRRRVIHSQVNLSSIEEFVGIGARDCDECDSHRAAAGTLRWQLNCTMCG